MELSSLTWIITMTSRLGRGLETFIASWLPHASQPWNHWLAILQGCPGYYNSARLHWLLTPQSSDVYVYKGCSILYVSTTFTTLETLPSKPDCTFLTVWLLSSNNHLRIFSETIFKMSAPIFQQLATLPARSRQGLNNLRQRLFQQGMLLPLAFRPSRLSNYWCLGVANISHRRETAQRGQHPTNVIQCSSSSLDHCWWGHVHQHGCHLSHTAIHKNCC